MSTPGSPLDQLVSNNQSLVTYFKNLSTYIRSGGSLPDLKTTVLDLLDYSELLRRATQDANGTADPSTAIAVEEVHMAASVLREAGMAARGKSELYLAIAADSTSLSDYHNDKSSLHSSLLSGSTRIPYLQ